MSDFTVYGLSYQRVRITAHDARDAASLAPFEAMVVRDYRGRVVKHKSDEDE